MQLHWWLRVPSLPQQSGEGTAAAAADPRWRASAGCGVEEGMHELSVTRGNDALCVEKCFLSELSPGVRTLILRLDRAVSTYSHIYTHQAVHV